MSSPADAPFTDNDLWRHILMVAGGIRRDPTDWDPHCTVAENRRRYRYLDRANGQGRGIDCLAQEIDLAWPWYGIHDGADLWAWLEATS